MIDHTHHPDAGSWVKGADAHPDFPVQNLPLGIFSTGDGGGDRCGTAIGSKVLDLRGCARDGLLPREFAGVLEEPTLNALLALGNRALGTLRHRLFALLVDDAAERSAVAPHLYDAAACTLRLPVRIGGYTDFYAGIVHATNVGRLLRPDNPLMPNYKHVPIGYNGRASSVRASDDVVRRPVGQLKGPEDEQPRFAPSARLDYEVELGLWIGTGNARGEPIRLADAGDHLAGISLLNDWSARDIQAWEYQPLGPFLAKTFATTVSPWIVTAAALAPFRVAPQPRPEGDPAPLPYLDDPADRREGGFAIAVAVAIRSAEMARRDVPARIVGSTHASHLYWTPGQMIAHHSSNGCNLEAGDLLGTGTISAPGREGFGSLMEVTYGGKEPFDLAPGETRRFLEDGDEVVMTGRCERDGYRTIGFGECRATIEPSLT